MLACKGAYVEAYQDWMKKNGGKLPHELTNPYLDTSPKLKCQNKPVYETGAKVI